MYSEGEKMSPYLIPILTDGTPSQLGRQSGALLLYVQVVVCRDDFETHTQCHYQVIRLLANMPCGHWHWSQKGTCETWAAPGNQPSFPGVKSSIFLDFLTLKIFPMLVYSQVADIWLFLLFSKLGNRCQWRIRKLNYPSAQQLLSWQGMVWGALVGSLLRTAPSSEWRNHSSSLRRVSIFLLTAMTGAM